MTTLMNIFVVCIFVSLCYAQNTITINATIYDHSPLRNPDFETTISNDRGLVQTTLGLDRKPRYAHLNNATVTVHNSTTFSSWFRDVPGVNLPISYTLKLTKGNNNIYTFSNSAFFPIDNKGFGNEGRSHNYHFCLELHSSFTYQGGEVFQFTGDDDVFVFIDNRLAIDLGGIHGAQSKSISLDSFSLSKMQNYKLDLFFCERHTTQSNLKLQTTLKLFCDYSDRCGVCEGTGESCPCDCDDGNDCTTDSCDAVSGICIFTGPKDCGSSGNKSGWANAGALVGIVVGGTAFVGLSVVGGKKAVDKYNARKQGQPPKSTTNSNMFYKWALKNKFPQPKPATTV